MRLDERQRFLNDFITTVTGSVIRLELELTFSQLPDLDVLQAS